MTVGVLTVILSIPGSNSLKDKRQVVKSVLANIRNKFNASAAEVDSLDSMRRAELGFAVVSNDKLHVNSVLDKILNYIESQPLCDIVETDIEFI